MDTIDRYMILSSDAHAGAPLAAYKEYLDPRWHDDFDPWLAAVVNPWFDVRDDRNWDSATSSRTGVADCIQLVPNDVDAAVSEMRWASRHRSIGGAMLPAIPPNHAVEPYFHHRYEPLGHAAVELGMPLHQHQGSGNPDSGMDQFERHPELRVVWTEIPGLRWAVEDLERMTRQLRAIQSRHAGNPRQVNYFQTFGSATTEGLSLTPLEYFRRNCHIGASLLRPYDVADIAVLGADRIMWGHDFPHPEGADGRTSDALRLNFWDFPAPVCRQMLSETAAEVYRFDIPALTAVAARIGPPVELVHSPLVDVPGSGGSAFCEPLQL